jgi:hypothetical protein
VMRKRVVSDIDGKRREKWGEGARTEKKSRQGEGAGSAIAWRSRAP